MAWHHNVFYFLQHFCRDQSPPKNMLQQFFYNLKAVDLYRKIVENCVVSE
jgi:hypothetical protein